MQFYEALKQEAAFLHQLIERTSRTQNRGPEGSLHVSQSSKGTCSYYHYQKKTKDKYPNGKYIPKKDLEKAQKLAQKEYDTDVYEYAINRLNLIQNLMASYDHESLHSIYQGYKEGRRQLIIPYSYEPAYNVVQWKNASYHSNPYFPEDKTQLTDRGEYVRSKSEKIIANRYLLEGIPYRYEPKVQLKSRIVYPDFQVLNIRTGQTYYHEHLGKMGDPKYVADNLKKIEDYIESGIYPGEKLLITAETSDHEFSGVILEHLIEHYLK